MGHVFSDDAYYSKLAYDLYAGNFPGNYLGYPIFLLRINQTALIAFSFLIFGISETATIIFPFIFSIINIFLVFELARLITVNETTSLIAAFLYALFPTDIIFSTLAFPDLINAFFINLGIFFLWKSYKDENLVLSFISGISFFISIQFKEIIYYIFILIIILLPFAVKEKKIKYLLPPVIIIILNFFVEGIIYLFINGNFFYRLNIMKLNYSYSFYDFFPSTVYESIGHHVNYWFALLYQIFIINFKSTFLRRFYLFIPVIALVLSIINLKRKKNVLLSFWFLGLAILMIAFTTSLTQYKPLDLHRNWYIYPLIMPMIILTAVFLENIKKNFRWLLFTAYIAAGIFMSFNYTLYFGKDNLSNLKSFIRSNPSKIIYTDHFTKYSVDLIRDYKTPGLTKRISGENFDLRSIPIGDWVLFNQKHIDELKLQNYKFPNFTILKSDSFKIVKSFDDFKIYAKQL